MSTWLGGSVHLGVLFFYPLLASHVTLEEQIIGHEAKVINHVILLFNKGVCMRNVVLAKLNARTSRLSEAI